MRQPRPEFAKRGEGEARMFARTEGLDHTHTSSCRCQEGRKGVRQGPVGKMYPPSLLHSQAHVPAEPCGVRHLSPAGDQGLCRLAPSHLPLGLKRPVYPGVSSVVNIRGIFLVCHQPL